MGFDAQSFSELHVFHQDFLWIADDLVERQIFEDRLSATFAEFDLACDNVPPEWWWQDDGVPTLFNREAVRAILGRYTDNDFWRIA